MDRGSESVHSKINHSHIGNRKSKILLPKTKAETALSKMIANVYMEGGHRIEIQPATNSRKCIVGAVSKALNLSTTEFYLMQNGKLLQNDDEHIDIESSAIRVCLRLCGGKGGFGSMLRAIGAQIEKTTNREACRDLSGRRLRDINEEKRMKEYLEKQANNQEDQAAKVAKKIKKLQAKPKHEFNDDEYFQSRSTLLEDVSDAIEEGLKNAVSTSTATTSAISSGDSNDASTAATAATSGSGIKRKNAKDGKKQKKKLKGAQWLDEGLSSDDSSDSDDDSTSTESSAKNKSAK